jgi:hypothetical protein
VYADESGYVYTAKERERLERGYAAAKEQGQDAVDVYVEKQGDLLTNILQVRGTPHASFFFYFRRDLLVHVVVPACLRLRVVAPKRTRRSL